MSHYMSDRFEWAAPGDQQEDAWVVRFCDRDMREAVFTGDDAEQDAWAAYNRYAPSYNVFVFRLARLRSVQSEAEGLLREMLDEFPLSYEHNSHNQNMVIERALALLGRHS